MKTPKWIIMAAVMTCVLPAKAQDQRASPAAPALVGGSFFPIYAVTGVRGSGVDNTGPATTFICTNFSGVTETFKFKLFDSLGNAVIDQNVNVDFLKTQTASTNATVLFSELLLGAPVINPPGFAGIFATSTNVTCTAMLVDAANASAQGIALHMQRYNPLSGTME